MSNSSTVVKSMALSLLVAFVFAFVSGPAVAQESDVAIKVNGEVVEKSELNERIDQTFERMKKRYGDRMKDEKMQKTMRKRVRQQVVDQTVEQLILKTNAEQSGVSVGQKEVTKQLEAQKKRFNSEEQFNKALEKQGMSPEDFRDRVREDLLVQKFLDKKMGTVSVSDEQARQFYQENQKRYGENSFEEVKSNIKQLLRQRKQQKQRQQLVDQLREESEVDVRV